MKKFYLLLTALLCLIIWPQAANATTSTSETAVTNGEFRVGMEAGYAPFNWTQQTDANGAVPISGDSSYAGGYDVEIAKKIAAGLGKELVIVKTEWDGLLPSLQSGVIDAIIAGMSPTEERRQEIDFTDAYYESDLVIVTRNDTRYATATSLADFAGARITAQLSTFHYDVIDQIPDVEKLTAYDNFAAMRVALESGTIDGYVSERPEGVTAQEVNPDLKMVEFADGQGFNVNPEDVQVSVGLQKNSPYLAEINQILAGISEDERIDIMDNAIETQPATAEDNSTDGNNENAFVRIIRQNGTLFLQGAGMTLFLAIIGTFVGTFIGLLVGVYRTTPLAANKIKRGLQKFFGWVLSAYIEIFRGTPMIVQAAVFYYGMALAFNLDMNRTVAALIIVSVNTGAYMSEIVRGGIFSVDKGQFEAAQAIGMTHRQTMLKVVLPQVMRNILPATGNEFVINIKDTSVLSIISVTELFFQGKSAAGTNYMFFQTYAIICVIYFVLTFTITRILRVVEKRMDGPDSYEAAENTDVLIEADK
ncbi:ABC transporter permease subunit [Enterococcus sp. HY326]|uniref:ABC transporter permease subunit n=1 Tax=Enterococcus sp. HY326 TaxID=2971265 RepID=UPI0022400C07|nr:ABC transporter permease subunit [Enterococcus sp. HY326]